MMLRRCSLSSWSLLGSLVIAAIALTPATAFAQAGPTRNPTGSLEQANGSGSAAANAQSAAVIASPNSDIAGLDLVNKYPVPDTFTFATDQTAFWTDNAFLTPTHTVSSFAYNGRLSAAYVPYSTRDWTPTISFEQQFIRFDSASVLDFNVQTAMLSSQYAVFKDKSLMWNATYSLQRLYTDRDHLGEFYQESFFDNGLVYTKAISKENNVYFQAAYDIGWRLTNPQQYSRVDNSFLASVIWAPRPDLRVQAFARPAIYEYTDNREFDTTTGTLVLHGRTDYNVALGLSASYTPIKYFILSSGIGWTGNYSNVGDREYRSVSPTVTAGGRFSF